ncbi:unnamed protein product [Rotaria socialis]|uniref:Nucleoporin Nup133/Nup155-like C-terminal domain-containing protein n=1 Tax=Rotaria socialis TaxID=392032 RepID=A0A817PX48_9BILA|nr:unnamed protein product [Rotaria socialis]CAF3397933.1 unnamed protein product [Rotaria socialis]CAF4263911.1 unnamed protein product [Rotaria socialis]CAF4345808.1 unnamed protein product [Rotaria socialis]
MATSPSSPMGTILDNNTRDFYQQISTWLNEFFQLTSFTDIEYSIRSSSINMSTILTTSGGTDGSYTRSFPYEPTNRISIPSATITSIPGTITEQQQNTTQTTPSVYRSGYILSMNMLWLSIDQKLYLWKYPTIVDLIELEFDSIVLACNCVRRRKSTTTNVTKKLTHSTSFLGSWLPSVMTSSSKFPATLTTNDLIENFVHLLVILTCQDILIYTIDDQQSTNIQRWYTTPTLKYTLNQIGYFDTLSISNERFFLGGQCGDIYEFIYEENVKSTLTKLGQTFLSNLVPSFLQLGSLSQANAASMTVKQITVDHKRLLLYARLANDSLHIYDVSTDKGHRLFNYTFDDLISKLKQRQTISYDDYRPFLTMCTVQSYESSLFNLILVTHTGIRLYYTLIMPTGQANTNPAQPTQQSRLELIHVRYPPTIPNLPQTNAQQPIFRTGYVDMNCLFLFTSDSNRPQSFGRMILLTNSDSTLLTSSTLLSSNFNDSTMNQQPQQQQQRPTSEIQSQLFNELFLIQEQISLLTLNILPLHMDLTQTPTQSPRIGPLAQNIRYMIQTYDSIVTFDIPRSNEHLRLLLFYDQQIHSLLMKQFFSYYSLRYSCSMSLALTLTSLQDSNTNTTRVNDDRLRDLAFQTFLWYSSSAYLQYLETMQQQQISLDQSRFYQLQSQQPFSRSTPILPSIYMRQKNFFERYIIPLRINAILFVLSDILRPIWAQKLVELKSLSKQDKTIYYIFHKIHDYNEIKSLLKQLEHFLKKLAPHMCCLWSNKDDLPEYNEQLAQKIYAQQNIQMQPPQQQQQQHLSAINSNNNQYLRSALAGRLNEQTPQQQTIHHAHSYPNISTYAQSPFGHGNPLNTSIAGGINPAADFTLSSPTPPVQTGASLFSSSMHNLPPTTNSPFPSVSNTSIPLAANSANLNQQYFLSATSLSSITDLLQEIDYYRTICHMSERLIELLSLWQIINENRTDMLIERLPESYLTLFNGTNGPFTVRTLLDLDTFFYDTLIAALLTSYEQNESVFDQLMGRLVDECPKLCPIEKLILYKVDLFLKPSSLSTTTTQTINDQHQRLKQACQLYKQVCDRVNITSFAMTLYTYRMYDELLDLCVTAGSKRDPCNQALNYYYGQLDDQQQYVDVYQRRSECYQSLIDILESLYQRDGDNVLKSNDGSLTLNEFVRHCLSYDDEFLHVKLFDWMMNKQFNEKIKSYRQVTPYLERFIRYRLKLTNFNDYITLDVAIAVLQVVKDYTTLCQVLLHLIDLLDPRVTFADRLCYLAEALQIARSTNATLLSTSQQIKSSSDSQLTELIPTLEQRLQTAFVQKQIYTDLQMYMRALETHTITSTIINDDLQQHIEHIQYSIKKLDSALFDATELFVDYAQKYELYECQLLLLQLDGNEEPTILQTIWRRLLRKEVNDLFPSTANVTGGNYERIMILQQHLIERLRNCRKKRLRLPMDFIRGELKQIAHTLNNHSDHGDIVSSEDFSNKILSDL